MVSSVDILVPEAGELVQPWYSSSQAAADGMPPHITLLWPWVDQVDNESLRRLTMALEGITRFDLTFRCTGRFPGVLYLAPEPSEQLLMLARKVWTTFPETPPYGGQLSHEPILHLTVAKSTDDAELDDIESEVTKRLRSVNPVRVARVSVSQEGAGPDGRWGVRAHLALGEP
jgi:2'-5' RNA ligase